MMKDWWNGSDLLGWIAPIVTLVGLAFVVGTIYVIAHFIIKYW